MNILQRRLLILASAGSGKTYQLVNRMIGLVAGGTEPERIVALTFTRKAAGEFADAVLNRLAEAASDSAAALELRGAIGKDADFSLALEQVVKALPRFTLGTMDSFFSKVVRGFQYQLGLTGGKFDLLEGPRADAARDEIIADILGGALARSGGEEFFHAFRRANLGREELRVQEPLRHFLREWHSLYRSSRFLDWGPSSLASAPLDEWEKQKNPLMDRAEKALAHVAFTDKRQPAALEKALDIFRNHTIGSGSLGEGGISEKLLEAAAAGTPLEITYYKPLAFGEEASQALMQLMTLAAECELSAALLRTRAIREVVSAYDALCENRLRRNGLLGFDEVKELMGAWAKSEDARLRRELVDFRLDARYQHWLLDEFQDTSRADWHGLLPLLDEAADDGTIFIVGDRKQAIYGWRGGDVALFDEVITRYGNDLGRETITESWRSCPQVLELVNRVCGDTRLITQLFGKEATDRWEWQDHQSAAPLNRPGKQGEARIERLEESWEERIVPLLKELGIGTRNLTCGVLVRNNKEVREIADHLRAADFDVVEEGRRQPAKDGPVGLALFHLVRWLAEPCDRFSLELVAMSPLAAILQTRYGEEWSGIWSALLANAAEVGFSGMVSAIVEESRDGWSAFGRQRGSDIVAALAEFDMSGGVTAREASDWLNRLEIAQSPGAAAVQVMTIHKSKGLGFDVVIIPQIPSETVPQTQHFNIARGESWLTGVPPSWARDLLPEIAEAEEEWRIRQRYESFCMLYVALTRAKRGLYVFLDPAPKKTDPTKPSLSNWLATATDADQEPGIAWQSGSASWIDTIPLLPAPQEKSASRQLPPPIPRRDRTNPSSLKMTDPSVFSSSAGMRFGREIHAAFESIGWLDEDDETSLPPSLRKMVNAPSIRRALERRGRDIQLLREQPVEAIVDGKWLSGTIDRLHLHRSGGEVFLLEVIDFKTDTIDHLDLLRDRYVSQMQAYRGSLRIAYPHATVECLLVSTHLEDSVSV